MKTDNISRSLFIKIILVANTTLFKTVEMLTQDTSSVATKGMKTVQCMRHKNIKP